MKKPFVFLLAIMYLTQASGMGMHLHYCMDKLVSWGLTGARQCAPCDKKKDPTAHIACKDCCRDEHKTARLDGALKTGQAFDLKPFTLQTDQPGIYFPGVFPDRSGPDPGGKQHQCPTSEIKGSIVPFISVFRI